MTSWLPKEPSWLRKIALCPSQLVFSNFEPHVINRVSAKTLYATVHRVILSGLADMISNMHNFIISPLYDLIQEKQKQGPTYHPRYLRFYQINVVTKHPSSSSLPSSLNTRWSHRSPTSCLFIAATALFSRDVPKAEILFLDIQNHWEFPFGH